MDWKEEMTLRTVVGAAYVRTETVAETETETEFLGYHTRSDDSHRLQHPLSPSHVARLRVAPSQKTRTSRRSRDSRHRRSILLRVQDSLVKNYLCTIL